MTLLNIPRPRQLLATSALLGALLAPGASAFASDTTVRLEISGLRNDKGDVGCLLFSAADGYPDDHAKAHREIHSAIAAERANCVFADLRPGTYAAIVWHDENRNGKIDRNFVGIPTEGYMASNGVRPKFSAPGFKEASFVVKAGAVTTQSFAISY
jgi:uncharacterized protein (DUF2141 family)